MCYRNWVTSVDEVVTLKLVMLHWHEQYMKCKMMVTNKFEWKLNDIQFTWKHNFGAVSSCGGGNGYQCVPPTAGECYICPIFWHACSFISTHRLSLKNHTCVQIHHKYRFLEPNGLCMCFETAPILNRRFAYANRIRLLLFCSASMRLSSVFRVIASKYLLSWCLNGHLYFFVWMIYIPLCCTQQLPRKFVTFQLELKCPTVWRANIIPNNLYDGFFVKKKKYSFQKIKITHATRMFKRFVANTRTHSHTISVFAHRRFCCLRFSCGNCMQFTISF